MEEHRKAIPLYTCDFCNVRKRFVTRHIVRVYALAASPKYENTIFKSTFIMCRDCPDHRKIESVLMNVLGTLQMHRDRWKPFHTVYETRDYDFHVEPPETLDSIPAGPYWFEIRQKHPPLNFSDDGRKDLRGFRRLKHQNQ